MMERQEKAVIILIAAMVVAVIAATSWFFLVRKDYEFVVEVPCDPETEICYARDCEEEECPVNGLETYTVFTLRAADFARCADGTCLMECRTGEISCSEAICGESEEDVCAAPAVQGGNETEADE